MPAVGMMTRGIIRKENDEEEFTSETDKETNPAAAIRLNEAQKTANNLRERKYFFLIRH